MNRRHLTFKICCLAGLCSGPASLHAADIPTTGASFDLSQASTWAGSTVPGAADVAVFNASGIYTAPNATVLNWLGLRFDTTGVELDPLSGNITTLNIGTGGITGSSARLGRDSLRVHVGANDQSWAAQGNVGARVIGSAVITTDSLWLRNSQNANSSPNGFGGTWRINSGQSIRAEPGGLGNSSAAIEMGESSGLRFTGTIPGTSNAAPAITLTGASATIRTGSGLALSFAGPIGGGSLAAPANLALTGDSHLNPNSITFNGSMAGHVGSIELGRANTLSSFTANFSLTSTLAFAVGANGVADGVDTSATALIRAATGIGVTNANFDGTINFDLTSAAMAAGNAWRILDPAGMTATFGASFAITDFTAQVDGVTWTRSAGLATWTFSESTGTLSLALAEPALVTVPTSGTGVDMSLAGTWQGGVVPNNVLVTHYIAAFTAPATYVAPAGSVFNWHGIEVTANGTLEINPMSGGNAYTIRLGKGGIFGTQNIGRLGTNLAIDVGANDQTWSVSMGNVQATTRGSAIVTYNNPSTLWLRGPSTFTGTWRVDSGLCRPDSNTTWSAASGATCQLLNNGTLRLADSAYDRVRLEMLGNGNLLGGGASSNLNRGTGTDTGDIYGPGNLTITGSVNLNGDVRHTGNTLVNGGVTLTLGGASTTTFTLGSNKQIGSLLPGTAGTRTVNLNGPIAFDLGGRFDPGQTWAVIDRASLAVTYGPGFTVQGFTESAGVWTRADGRTTWTFTAATGVLSASVQGNWFVDSASGQDTNPGSAGQPFRTLTRAAQAALPGQIVLIRGGTYRETFTPPTSGTSGAPITFASFPNETATLSAYEPVTGWSATGNGIYAAPVPVKPTAPHVLIGGESAIEARWPNHTSWDIIESPRSEADSTSNSGALAAGEDTVTDAAIPSGMPADWLSGARMMYKDWYRAWSADELAVNAFNPIAKSVTLSGMMDYSNTAKATTDPFYFELFGSVGLIDMDREWAHVSATGMLHLRTPGGVDPSTLLIETPVRTVALNLSSRAHIRIENINIIGGRVTFNTQSNNCVINGASVLYTLDVNLDGTNCEISDSEIRDSVVGRVSVGGLRNRFVNNRINTLGRPGKSALYLICRETLIAHNTIQRSYEALISMSITWRNQIVHNILSDGPLRTTDMGMLYSVYDGGMSEIAYNRFLTDHRKLLHRRAIYLDGTASHYAIHHNIFHHGALHGQGLLVFNNTWYRWDDYGDGPSDPQQRIISAPPFNDATGTLYLNNLFGYVYQPIVAQPSVHNLDQVYDKTAQFFNDTSGLALDALKDPLAYDFTLKTGSPAIDAGTHIEGITNGFTGTAPDLGAYESGKPAWTAGQDLVNKPVIAYDYPTDGPVARYANLLRNGQFGDPGFSGVAPWTVEGGTAINQFQAWNWGVLDLAYRAQYSVRMRGATSGIRQLASSVPGGRSYVFAAWIRPTSTAQTFELGVELPGASVIKTTAANLPVGTSRWTRMFVKFDLPAGSHPVTAFIRKTSADTGDAYFDEAFLIESFTDVLAPPAPGNASRFLASEDTASPGSGTTNLAENYTLVLQKTVAIADSSKPYFRFALQSLVGRSIDQATLRLTNTGDNIFWRIAVQEVTGAWTTTGPGYLTSTNRPAVGATVATIEQQGGSAMLSSADLTAHLRQRLAADGIVSLTLDDLNNSGEIMTIASSEWITNAPPTLNDSPALDVVLSLPPVPAALAGSANGAAINLTWSGSPDSLTYEIRRADSAQGPFVLLATVTSPAFSDTTITPGTSYYYTVTGINERGAGVASAPLTVTLGFSNWVAATFANGAIPGAQQGTSVDFDGDSIVNLLEYAFDTDPTVASVRLLTTTGGVVITHGSPLIRPINVLDYEAVFLRRKDHAASGLTYTAQFSTDLSDWVDSAEIPTVIASDATTEAVRVSFPTTIEAPTFFRLKVINQNAN